MATVDALQLSPHFSLEELTATEHRDMQWVNFETARTSPDVLDRLFNVARHLGEPVREKFGPVHVNSGFRYSALNTAVGSHPGSQHLLGEAMDFTVPGVKLATVFDWIRFESGIPFGQIILEGGPPEARWFHLSLGEPYRDPTKCRQALIGQAGAGGVFHYVAAPAGGMA